MSNKRKMNTDFCEKYNMLPQNGLVLCAVSGGKDSMYLLENLRALAEERGFTVCCAHFDHRLRETSDRDRRLVEDWCGKIAIPCYSGSGDVAAHAREKGMSIEEAARELRYAFLEKTAEETGAVRIATAHTADDNAETVLMNLARGSGLRGLCGIPPVRGRIIRPMLTTTTAQVLDYLEKNRIPHVEDETNALDECTRNIIRHRVIPELRRAVPGFDGSVSRCIELLRGDEEYLSGLAREFVRENFSDNALPAEKTAALPGPVFARAAALAAGEALSQKHIEALAAIASGKDGHAASDIPGMRVKREYDKLVFGSPTEESFEAVSLSPGESVAVPELEIEAECRFVPEYAEIHNSDNTFLFESDSICGKITLRPRREGDSIRLDGRGCTKTLKKLFAENRLKGSGQGRVVLLCDEAGVIAVRGFGIAERCRPRIGGSAVCVELKDCRESGL